MIRGVVEWLGLQDQSNKREALAIIMLQMCLLTVFSENKGVIQVQE